MDQKEVLVLHMQIRVSNIYASNLQEKVFVNNSLLIHLSKISFHLFL